MQRIRIRTVEQHEEHMHHKSVTKYEILNVTIEHGFVFVFRISFEPTDEKNKIIMNLCVGKRILHVSCSFVV